MSEEISQVAKLWHWLKDNDLPGWVAVAFTAIVWPIVLFLWSRRRVNGIPHLEVRISAGDIKIAEQPFAAIAVDFLNHTGAVVYVTRARVTKCTHRFVIPQEAARDISDNSHHLKFLNRSNSFVDREITLQTNGAARTTMAVSQPPDATFYSYHPSWWRRWLRMQKYFVIEYTAMVGSARYFVATLY